MADLGNFDARTVEPADSFDPIPAGWYLAAIIKSEKKPTNDQTGEYVELTFQVLAGPYKGRQVWVRLNLKNRSAEAVRIARGELSAICRAVAVMTPRDSEQLHNRPLEIKVTVVKRKDNGEPANEVKGFRKRGGMTPAPQAPQQPPPAAPSAPLQGVPPQGPYPPQPQYPQTPPQYPQPQPQPQYPQQPATAAAGMPAAGPPETAHPLAAPASYPTDASGRPINENGDIAPWA